MLCARLLRRQLFLDKLDSGRMCRQVPFCPAQNNLVDNGTQDITSWRCRIYTIYNLGNTSDVFKLEKKLSFLLGGSEPRLPLPHFCKHHEHNFTMYLLNQSPPSCHGNTAETNAFDLNMRCKEVPPAPVDEVRPPPVQVKAA